MRIELLHVPECPNLAGARTTLAAALDAAGETASVQELEIDTPAAAARAGMRGSPTFLVDGDDPFATDSEEASLSCRLYATPDGLRGSPSVAQLIEAISR